MNVNINVLTLNVVDVQKHPTDKGGGIYTVALASHY